MSALERTLARLLGYGTAAASLVTAAGVALSVAGAGSGSTVAEVGIAMFVALPLLRLAVMARAFSSTRHRQLAAVTCLVLAIVVVGAILGALTPGARG